MNRDKLLEALDAMQGQLALFIGAVKGSAWEAMVEPEQKGVLGWVREMLARLNLMVERIENCADRSV